MHFIDTVRRWVGSLAELGIAIIALGVVLQVLFWGRFRCGALPPDGCPRKCSWFCGCSRKSRTGRLGGVRHIVVGLQQARVNQSYAVTWEGARSGPFSIWVDFVSRS